MEAFLEKTANYVADRYGDSLGELCLVFPNRRAGLFFRQFLAHRIGKTTWMPKIYSTEDFVLELSGLQLADPVSLLFDLYDIYKSVEKENAQPFDDFLNWGQVLLHDFNEMDQYLVDPVQLCDFLDEAKAIKLWNLDERPLTEFENRYLHFYNSIFAYYSGLTQRLLSKHTAYQGLAYRMAADHLEGNPFTGNWKKIIFAGFNALTIAEEKIIRHLIDKGLADILWDTDRYYLDDNQQEAGRFFRKYIDGWNFSDFLWKDNQLVTSEKHIQVIGVPNNMGQAKLCAQILSELAVEKENINKTAVVLADENLLMPVLNSLPNNIGEFNITMGYPLKFTPLYDLFDTIFELHENSEKLSATSADLPAATDKTKFYFRDVLKILQHSYIQRLFNNNHKVIQDFYKENRVFFLPDAITKILKDNQTADSRNLYAVFESLQGNSTNLLDHCLLLIDALRLVFASETQQINSGSENGQNVINIEEEYLFAFAKIVKRLKTVLLQDEKLKISSFRKIFTQIIGTSTLPFYGEPLKGVQIMGMLETRNLDFENIILLSANEDKIPSAKSVNTFIPLDIRQNFQMPTYRDKNAIFAYHFYRLLQKGKKIFLVYNTETDDLGGGDKSRFITQIANELPQINPKITFSEQLLSVPPSHDAVDHAISIDKTPEIIQKLVEKSKKGFSPTTLNNFISCSLKFYFQEIACLEEPLDVEETVEAATMGKIVHDVLKELYQPYLGKILIANDYQTMLSKTERLLEERFMYHYQSNDILHGRNHLIMKVIYNFIFYYLTREKHLSEERQEASLTLFVEQPLETEIIIENSTFNGGKLPVKIKGIADRIDKQDLIWQLIDYKTGLTKPEELKVGDWDNLLTESKLGKSLQLLSYAWLFYRNNSLDIKLKASIMSFRSIGKGLMNVSTPQGEIMDAEGLDKFEMILKELINQVFDAEKPFCQTADRDICTWCPYKIICNR